MAFIYMELSIAFKIHSSVLTFGCCFVFVFLFLPRVKVRVVDMALVVARRMTR